MWNLLGGEPLFRRRNIAMALAVCCSKALNSWRNPVFWLKEFLLLPLTFPQLSCLLLPAPSPPRSLAPCGVWASDILRELETCSWKRPGKAGAKGRKGIFVGGRDHAKECSCEEKMQPREDSRCYPCWQGTGWADSIVQWRLYLVGNHHNS